MTTGRHRHRSLALLACGLAAGLALALAIPALAGEDEPDPDDTQEHGAPYFGDVKDIDGLAPIPDARVKVQLRGTYRFIILQSDEEGRFRRSGLGVDVDANKVEVVCEKSGYRAVDVLQRRLSREKFAAVEVECLMEKVRS